MMLMCENDNYFNNFIISSAYYRIGGFEFSGEFVASVFAACPDIEELHVLFNKRLYRTMWLQDCINDDFLRCIAQCCPELKKLTINEVDVIGRKTVTGNVTDQGLSAIASMSRLRSITLKQTRCSAHEILALVLLNPNSHDKRYVVINASSTAPEHTVQFHDLLTEFMAAILAQPTHALANHRFKLELIVHGVREVRDREAVRQKLLAFKERLAVQHPGIAMVFCGQSKKTKKAPVQLENVGSVVSISTLHQQQS